MKVVIVHHNLRDGEVTRIIQDQVEALKSSGIAEISLLVGNSPDNIAIDGVDIKICEELDFLDYTNVEPHDYDLIASRVYSFLEENIDRETIIHAHNCNYGRNPLLTYAIYRLAWKGVYVVNHCHDFAQDFPANNALMERIIHGHFKLGTRQVMYPTLNNYSFAVQNNYDKKRLKLYGVPNEKITVLPNPVKIVNETSELEAAARLQVCNIFGLAEDKLIMTYPVRAIPRKNVGEFLLLSVLFQDEASWLVTRPPQNPQDADDYYQWKNFADEHQLDVKWEVENKCSFQTIMSGTDFCVTSNTRQGYGKVYLEPWLYSKPVVGRELSTVVDDFKKSGVSFPFLYSKLKVNHYNMECDFKELEMQAQMNVIIQVMASEEIRQNIFSMNPDIAQIIKMPSVALINDNKLLIEDVFSCDKYGEKLQKVYEELVS